MAIALEISSLLVPALSGVGVYGNALIEELRSRELADSLHGVYRFGRRTRLLGKAPAGLPRRPYLGGQLLHRYYPVLHALDTRFPTAYRGRLVATLFDMLSLLPEAGDLELAPPRFRAKKLRQYRAIAKHARVIISISEDTRRRFLEAFGSHDDNRSRTDHRVVYPGVNAAFRPEAADPERLRELGLSEHPYVLFVGELCRKKNLEAVADVFLRVQRQQKDLRLVLVGRPSYGWKGSKAESVISAHSDVIEMLGFRPLTDLAAIYAGARAFLFLSHYEGFGLPVLEAMASGAPVIASNRGGIPEAVGEAGLLVDPGDIDAVTDRLRTVLYRPRESDRLRAEGLARARQFSWDRTATSVAAVYRQVVSEA